MYFFTIGLSLKNMYLEITDLFVYTLFVCEIVKLKCMLKLYCLTCKNGLHVGFCFIQLRFGFHSEVTGARRILPIKF